MLKNKLGCGVLVYDRYYGNKPSTVMLTVERLLLCCGISLCAIMYTFTEYQLPVDISVMALVTSVASAVFFLLFHFIKKRVVLPAILVMVAAVIYFTYEKLLPMLSYFVDSIMLMAEGRFIYPRQYLLNEVLLLTPSNPDYINGISFGLLLLSLILSLVCALSTVSKIKVIPVVLLTVVYCIPCMLSERLEFNFWLIPFVALMLTAAVISDNYRFGISPFNRAEHKVSSRREERTFIRSSDRSSFLKRISMRTSFYSKYFSVGLSAAVILAVTSVGAAILCPPGTAVSYTKIFDAISNIGNDFGVVSSPFEEGPAAEYFTGDAEDSSSELNIISPGDGERDIIKVSFTGNQPIYLRGDIGVDFTGRSWTSLVSSTPEAWTDKLSDHYRPCELKMTRALLSASKSESFADTIVSSEDVRIEYLCETDVVFLPPYTGEFSYYDNGSFNVYGDLVLRVNRNSGSYVNAVECTALVPSYTNTEVTGDVEKIAAIEKAYTAQSVISPDEIAATVLTDISGNDKLITSYGEYVRKTYLSIDDSIRSQLMPLMFEMGMLGDFSDKSASDKYAAASHVAAYLRDNYTYTTENINGNIDPVMNFLYTTKRGHCSLYASAMTLMLRDMGIPARYCTGFYVVTSNRFGDTLVLKEKNLHAWVEVYLDEIGWVTFDPTSSAAFPGISEDGINNTDTAESGEDESIPNQDVESSRPDLPSRPDEQSSISAESDVTSSPVVTPSEEVPTDITAYIPFIIAICAVVLIALIVCGVILWYRSIKYGAINSIGNMRDSEPTRGGRIAYLCILDMLSYYGLTISGGEMPVDFYKRVDDIFGTDLCSVADLIASIEFGTAELTDSQRGFIVNELVKIYGKLLKRFKLIGNRISVMKIVKRAK